MESEFCNGIRVEVVVHETVGFLHAARRDIAEPIEDGFEYEGQYYRSLTVIAERITGAHWSGPRFFGLSKRPGAF
jgi:hypothetical protein